MRKICNNVQDGIVCVCGMCERDDNEQCLVAPFITMVLMSDWYLVDE